ncbi:MAG TPA: hypothetical protein EYP98_17775, partial [Planctomycetes bacterium]|nr:hypothetical protein [Planctomycetota bacterium]
MRPGRLSRTANTRQSMQIDYTRGMRFLNSDMSPAGDQPHAIETISEWIEGGAKASTLLGVTGSGKTFTVAKLVERLQRPTLVLAPNKTLAAQLYGEFKSFFPDNAVEYFVSYYDYYQPEAYVPTTDTFIEKDAMINTAIERMRNSATRSLMERRDVLIVASISCIYGLGSPENYRELSVQVKKGQSIDRDVLLRQLTAIQFVRDNYEFQAGRFRVRGDVVEVYPSYEEARAIRIEMFGDEIESIFAIDPLRGEILEQLDEITIYPTTHYIATSGQTVDACAAIETELEARITELEGRKKLLEAQRLGLDGVHLTDGSRSVRVARKELGPDAIVGAFCGTSRHDGMVAGEAGADYVALGP